MWSNPEQFLSLYRAQLESLAAATRATLEIAERLRTRQLEATRQAATENAECCREITAAKTPEELFAAQARLVNHQLDVSLGYWARLAEAGRQAQVEAAHQLDAQTTRLFDGLNSLLDAAPAGSEPVANAMRALLQAARAACGFGAQAAEQAARLTETQIETATAGIREAIANARRKTA